MTAVTTKKLRNPQTASYDTVAATQNDGLILAKLHYFLAVSRSFTPFLTKYQTDAPMMPFLARDLTELVKSVLRRFLKKEHLKMTPEQTVKLDVTDKSLWVNHSAVDVGFGAESVLKVLRRKEKVSSRAIMEYNNECVDGLSKMVKKILEKSPLRYPLVHDMACLDPGLMYKAPEECVKKMKSLVHRLINAKQLAGGITAGDEESRPQAH